MDKRRNKPDLLCFSHLKWNFVFQRPQHLMVRWARDHRVFFIEEPENADGQAGLKVRQCHSGVYYVTPKIPAGSLRNGHNHLVRSLLNDLLQNFEISDYISWYYTPMALEFSAHLRPLALVYDCMDELCNFKNADIGLRDKEKELFGIADVVFTGGYSLYRSKGRLHPNIHPFPSSVDTAHYLKAREYLPDPEDQKDIPHPRLGFFGVLDERLDVGLVDGLARKRPNWHLTLVGPVVKINPADLPRRCNIHYLGQKSYDQLPYYLAGWDAAILPFAHNPSTRFISPTKTLEYLAGGKPVVSTSIEDVVEPYGRLGLAWIADTVEDFENAVEEALNCDAGSRLQKADDCLKHLSWDQTWGQMKRHVDVVLEQKKIRPFQGTMRARDHYDYLVVGAGFAGSVMAERLACAGKKILLCDKRPHVGGNAYDCLDKDGLLIHKYGPHIFHTNSDEVYDYLSQFTDWRPYQHKVLCYVDGKLLPMPINLDTINKLYGWQLNSIELEEFFKRVAQPRPAIRTSEDVIISKVGRELYEKFFRNYTRKHWGLDPAQLDATVIARIPVRTDRDDRYFTDKYQVMPAKGFTEMFETMASHGNITLALGTDHRELMAKVSYGALIYSGPVDRYFNFCFGKLPYRSLDFKFETRRQEVYQPVAVVNFPNDYDYTRITEFKHLTGQKHSRTSIVYEFPQAEGDPYYPIPRPENYEIYCRYHKLAQRDSRVHFVGRLGTYRYYNMDQVVAQALTLASKLIGVPRAELLQV